MAALVEAGTSGLESGDVEDQARHHARMRLRRSVLALMGVFRVSQTRLAAELGYSQPQLSERLNEKVQFREDELATIASLFGLDVPDLYRPDEAVMRAKANLRSRCFVLPAYEGQRELDFGPGPALAVVSG